MSRCASRAKEHDAVGGAPIPRVYFGLSAPAAASSPNILRALQTSSVPLNGHSGSTGENERGLTGTVPTMNGASVASQREAQDDDALFYTNGARRTTRVNQWSDAQSGVTDEAEAHDALLATDPPREVNISPSSSTSSPPSSADASGAVPPVASATADAETSDEAHTEKSADAHERHTQPVISAHRASSVQLAASSLSASSSSGWRTVDEKSQGAEPAGQGREAERAEALSTEKGQSADEIGAAPTDAQQHAALIAQQSTEVDNSVPAGMPTGQAPTSHRASSSLASSSSSSHPVEVHVLDTLAAGETDTSAPSPSSASDDDDEEGNDEATHSSGSVSPLGDSTMLRDPVLRVSSATKVPAAASTARPAAEVDSAMMAAHVSPVALATTDEPHRGRGEGSNDRQGDLRRDNRTRASAAFLDALSASSSSYDSGTESSQSDANVVPNSSPVAHGPEVVAVPSPQNESADEAQQQRSSFQFSRMNAPAPPISSSPLSTTGAVVCPGVSSPHDDGGHDDRGDQTSALGAECADAVQMTHRERDSDEGEAYESLQPPSSVEFSQTPHSTPPTPTTLTHPRPTERFIGEDRAVEDSSPEELAEWSAMHASRSMGFSMPVVIPTGFGFSRSDTRNFVAPPSSQGTSPDTDATSATDQMVRRAAGLDDQRPHMPLSRSPSERPPLSSSTRLSLSGRGGGGGASAHTRPSWSHVPNSPPRTLTTPNISVPLLDERRNAGNAIVLSGPSLRREDFGDVALYTVVLYQLYHQVAEQLDATCLYRLLRQIEPAGADAGQRLVLLRCCLEEVEGHERAVRALYGEHLIIPVEPCSMDTHSILTLQETLAFAHYILNMSTLPPAAAPATALMTPPTGPDTRLVELESPPQAPRESVHKTGACTGADAPHVREHTTGPRSQPQTPTPPPFNAVVSPGGLAVPVSIDDAPRMASASTKPPHPHPRTGRPAARGSRAKVSKLRLPVAMASSAGGVGSGGSSGGCASSRSSSPFSSGSNALTSSLPAENEKATVWLQRAAPLLRTAFAELSEGEPSVPVVRFLRVLKEFQLRVDLEPFHGLKVDRELTGTLSPRDFEWIIQAGLQVCASSESVFGPRFECIPDAYATARYSSFRSTSLDSSVNGAEQDNAEQSCNGLRAGRSGPLAGTPRTPLQSYINSLVNSPEMSRVVETGSDVEFPLIQANSAIALLFRLMRKAVQYRRRVQLADDQPSAAQPQGGPLTTAVRGGDTTVKPPLASDQPTPPTPSAHPSAQLVAPTAPRSAKGFRQSTPGKRGSRALRSSSGGTAAADQNPRRARPMPPGAAAAAPAVGARRHRGRHATHSASGRSPTSHSRDRLASPGSAVRRPSPSKRPKCTHPTEPTFVQQQGRQPRPSASRPASTRTPGQTPTYRHRDRRTSSVRSSPSSLGRAAGPRPARGSSDGKGKGKGTLSTRTETQVRPPSLASRPSAQRPPRRASVERRVPLLPHAPLPNTPPAMTQPILSMDWWLSFFQPPPPPQLSLDSAYAETPSSALRSLPVGAATSAVRASNRPGSRPSSGPRTPSFRSSLPPGTRDVYSSPSSRAREAQRVQRRDSMAAQHALRQRHRGQSPSTRSGPVDEDAVQNASRSAQRSPVSRRPLKRTSARDQHRRLRRSMPSTHVDKTHAQAVVAGPTTPAVASADAELLQTVHLLFSTRLQLIDSLVDLNARRNRTTSQAEEAALEADLFRLSAHLESTENELWRLLQRVPRGGGNDGAMRCPVEACDAAVMVNTADRIRPKEAAKPVPPLTAADRSVSADIRYSDDHNHSSNNNNGSVTNSGQMPHHSAGGRRFSSSHPSPPWASSFATTVTTHAHDYPLVGCSRSTNEPSSYGGSSSSVNLYNGASLNAPVVSLGAAIDDAPPQFLRRGFASAMGSSGDLGIASHTSRDTAGAGEGGGGSSGSGSAPHSGSPTAMLYTEEKPAASTKAAPSTAMATTNVASLVNNNSNGFSSSRPKAVVSGSSRADTESSHVQMADTESGSSPVLAGASPFASLANSRALFALQQTSLGTMNMSGFTSWEMSPRAPSYFTYGSAGGANSQTDVCRSLGDGSGQQARLWSAVRRAPNGFGGSYAAELASISSRMHGVPNGGASGSFQNTPMRSLAGLSPASPRDWMSTASVTSASYLPSALASSLPISRILADHMQNMSVLTTSPGEANMSIPLDVIPERSWSDEASLQLEHLPGFSG